MRRVHLAPQVHGIDSTLTRVRGVVLPSYILPCLPGSPFPPGEGELLCYNTFGRFHVMKNLKGLLGFLLGTGLSLASAQQNVQITLTLINPALPEYEMQVVNQNAGGSGWSVDQLHVLYGTAGILQSTSVPSGWTAMWDVPWDAIPHNLRFEANTPADRIAPGGARTFRFKMTTKTPVEDFYIQFRVVNGSDTKEYADRVKILSVLSVPADAPKTGMAITPSPGGGLQGALQLRYEAPYRVPATEFQLTAFDPNGEERDQLVYPEAPIRQPPHLEHYFLGVVSRQIDATGAGIDGAWTLCASGKEWNGSAFGFANLRWERENTVFPRPSLCWQFSPSVRLPDGSRLVQLRLINCGVLPLNGQLAVHLRGGRLLTCGSELAGWRRNFPPDFQTEATLAPNASREWLLTIPADTPPLRYFYGAFLANMPDGAPTEFYFAHQEVERPLLVGLIEGAPPNHPVQIRLTSSQTGLQIGFTARTDARSVWQVTPDLAAWVALYSDPAVYQPLWQVRIKPRGAVSQTFMEVLIPGGDTLDPYLRMPLILGDVNSDDCIDDADLLAILFAFGQTGNRPEDLNQDGVVDDADLLLVLFNFGVGC